MLTKCRGFGGFYIDTQCLPQLLKMTSLEVVDLCSDDELGVLDVKTAKLEPDMAGCTMQLKDNNQVHLAKHQLPKSKCRNQERVENRVPNVLSSDHSSTATSVLEQGQSPVNDPSISCTSLLCPAPLNRQFWKAGSYDGGHGSKVALQRNAPFQFPTQVPAFGHESYEKTESLNVLSTLEDDMDEEALETSNRTEFNMGNSGSFGLGSILDLAPKHNPFGGPFNSATINVSASPFNSTSPQGELFRPASFQFQSLQPLVQTQPTNSSAFSDGKNYVHVHPMFLHSNATSHKWVFGAIAELLDNAVDEIQNGATFVRIDKISNPRDGSPALLIQDDGAGMDLEGMRRCMSFGYSDKQSKSAIGQYGNGFKTSTMRLGADAIVFSRHQGDRILTQSIGLLSYTFLMSAGYDRIVVPMVDYEFETSSGKLEILHGREHFLSNISLLLKWSPFSTEPDLLKQFDDIGSHGTKVIIYNLWLNDHGTSELDFDADAKDVASKGDARKIDTIPAWRKVNEEHIGNRFHYSLRAYLSILYLLIPDTFKIILRGEVVKHHNIANDLKHIEYILYTLQSGCSTEGQVMTTIGFLKEAPNVGIHGFNVYHKNRLILPFWPVLSYSDSKGRGIVGILEANFIEPTHNKQDFERTSLFQKLATRLKEMTSEYWNMFSAMIGYQSGKKHLAPPTPKSSRYEQPVKINQGSHAVPGTKLDLVRSGLPTSIFQGRSKQGLQLKRKEHVGSEEVESVKRQALKGVDLSDPQQQAVESPITFMNPVKEQETINLMQENKKLCAKCLEYEKEEEQLELKVKELKSEIKKVEHEYSQMLAHQLQSLRTVKKEEKDA